LKIPFHKRHLRDRFCVNAYGVHSDGTVVVLVLDAFRARLHLEHARASRQEMPCVVVRLAVGESPSAAMSEWCEKEER
jgi:hypothetical protein